MNFKEWLPLKIVDEDLLRRCRLVYVFGKWGREVLLITDQDEVMACGINFTGCLGFDKESSHFYPTPVLELHKSKIKKLVFGGHPKGHFVLACTSQGKLCFWGDCSWGKVNISSQLIRSVQSYQSQKKFMKVACGANHCLALDEVGELVTWGNNSFGQLGYRSVNVTCDIPSYNIFAEYLWPSRFVVKIATGFNFCAVVLNNGEVWTWGSNHDGELGINHLSAAYSPLPVRVNCLNGIIIRKIVCGTSFVLALSDVSELYVWGKNDVGQLGLGVTNINPTLPIKNVSMGKIIKIAASFMCSISAALTENSKVYMWGKCGGVAILNPKEMPFVCLQEVFAYYAHPPIMYKPMVRQSSVESVAETVKKAFGDVETSDLIVVAEGREIYVHIAILKIRSNYFKTWLQEHWMNEAKGKLKSNRSYPAMYEYIRYLYTGELNGNSELAFDLLEMADEYQDSGLKKCCEKKIQSCINVENVLKFFSLGMKINAENLIKNCMSFVGNHMSAVIRSESFKDLDRDTVIKFNLECERRNFFKS